MSKNQVNRIWPMVTSAIFGFIIAVIIFMPEAYSKNKNIYKILKNKIIGGEPILSQTISLRTVESEIANSLSKVQY